MPYRAFRLAYDGRPFYGFQRQPDVPTIEDELFAALRTLDVTSGTPDQYSAAGRTDAGVSAIEQTVAFRCPEWLSPAALNSELPASIRAWATTDVPESFHATHDARQRVYTYHLYAPDADDHAVHATTYRLSGTHNFKDLTPDSDGTTRDLVLLAGRDGPYLVVIAQADGFPRHLVRRLVGLLNAIGKGELALDTIDTILDATGGDNPVNVPTAPASPLVLSRVEYELTFESAAATAASQEFEATAIDQRTAARVTCRIQQGIDTEI